MENLWINKGKNPPYDGAMKVQAANLPGVLELQCYFQVNYEVLCPN
jgi:hypothetical protein